MNKIRNAISQALARAYCAKINEKKVLDPNLIEVMVGEVLAILPQENQECTCKTPEDFCPIHRPFPKRFPISACCNASVETTPNGKHICEACKEFCKLADWNRPLPEKDKEIEEIQFNNEPVLERCGMLARKTNELIQIVNQRKEGIR